MNRDDAFEVIVLRTNASETKANGLVRTVTLMVPNDGQHPFQGLIGKRLHIVCLHLNDDETSNPLRLIHETPPPDRSSQRAEDGGSEGAGSVLPVRDPAPAKRKWNELPPAQQAAIRCGEPEFWEFMQTKMPPGIIVASPNEADGALKLYLGIDSKTKLNEWPSAWHSVEDDYWAWQRNPRRAA
jgi:hypothetical protein